MKNYDESDYIKWVDELAEKDYVNIDNFLSEKDLQTLHQFFNSKLAANDLDKAGIGTLGLHTINTEVRGDYVYWINQHNDLALNAIFRQTNTLIEKIKRYCFLSISDFECHLAFYPEKTFYKAHFDQFKERNNRILSFVLYLNKGWKKGDGGELIIHEKGAKTTIEPFENRLVLFKSASVLHEVSMTFKPRYSLTGWMLNNPVGLGFL
ncbi:MAG: 2OG-Fe(II) oxygenase [Putridiphycobacter sp.]|nr:2OG-Fe(II) oxygenase [Putridiphycobacter sp.]